MVNILWILMPIVAFFLIFNAFSIKYLCHFYVTRPLNKILEITGVAMSSKLGVGGRKGGGVKGGFFKGLVQN